MSWADVHASVDAHEPCTELDAHFRARGRDRREAEACQVQLGERRSVCAISYRKYDRLGVAWAQELGERVDIIDDLNESGG